MTSDDNIARALRYTAAVDRREVPTDLLAPDVRIENARNAITDRTYHGAEGVREWIEDIFDVLADDARFEAKPLDARDDWVFAEIGIDGRGAASGAPVRFRFYGVMWFDGGRIVRIAGFNTRREARAAIEQAERSA